MPRGDGTGPQGQGCGTGRKMGKQAGNKGGGMWIGTPRGAGGAAGTGRGAGSGMGQGRGIQGGRGSGKGAGRNKGGF